MRNAFTLLSLLALAASSCAVGSATATGTTDVTFTLDSGLGYSFAAASVNHPERSAGQYIYDWDSNGISVPASHNPFYEYTNDVTFAAAPVTDPSRYTGSVAGSSTGNVFGTNRLVLTSTSSGIFGATPSDPGDQFVFRRYGYRYFMELTNGDTASAHDATFDFSLQSRYGTGQVDVPYDLVHNLGQYAETDSDGGVVITSPDGTSGYDFDRETLDYGSGTGYNETHIYPPGTSTFTVPKATLDGNGHLVPGTLELEVYNSSSVFIEDDHRPAPVPEPSALAALGLGALALLRRRRGRRA